MKVFREIFADYLNVHQRINYRSFGYIPKGSIRDIRGKLFGHVNLLKRLQAQYVMVALDLQKNDLVLDVGCGSGYFTVEMAKVAQRTYGVDITPYLREIQIPSLLSGKLNFVMARGEKLPFQDNAFDKILASEILPMMEDSRDFLDEMKRVMKREGRLVLCNGAGHPSVKEAYQKGHWILKILRNLYGGRVPSSYESYCSILQKSFGTKQNRFLGKEDISLLLKETGFKLEGIVYSPSSVVGAYLSWSQFLLWVRKGKTLSQKYFHILYPIASIVNRLEKSGYEGGLICTARRS